MAWFWLTLIEIRLGRNSHRLQMLTLSLSHCKRRGKDKAWQPITDSQLGRAIRAVHLGTSWLNLQCLVAQTHVVRRATEVWLRTRSRAQLAAMDRLDAARRQTNTLLGLVHRAQNTSFGIEHDFRRMRNEDDYRRLVPVTNSAALARTYWQAADTSLGGTTWPSPVDGLATYDDGDRPTRQVLLSADLLQARRAALQTALALVLQSQPSTPILFGTFLFLGGPASVTSPLPGKAPPTPEAAFRSSLPVLCRPYCFSALDAPLQQEDGAVALDALAEKCVRLRLTLACGALGDIARLFDRVKTLANKERITEVWPRLSAVLYSCRPSLREQTSPLREEVGPNVQLLEMACFPEGIVAVEDPRHGLLRLLADQGVYCEFIPAQESSKRSPQRFGLSQVDVGGTYELAVTSPAGVWSCRAGAAVCVERLDPPLFRFVEMPRLKPAGAKREAVAGTRQDPAMIGLKSPPLRRRNGGTPAEPPENFGHNPWLIPVDRG
jgi:hypothetical protein